MALVQVKITGQAITARYGTLNTGDILRTDAAFAKHLVDDCSAAEYLTSEDGKTVEVMIEQKPTAIDQPTTGNAGNAAKDLLVPAPRKRGSK